MKLKLKITAALILTIVIVVMIESFWKAQALPDIPKLANPGDVSALMAWDPILGEMRLVVIDTAGRFIISPSLGAGADASVNISTSLADDFSVTTGTSILEIAQVDYEGSSNLWCMVFDSTSQPVDTTAPKYRFKVSNGGTTAFTFPPGGLSCVVGVHLVLSDTQLTLGTTHGETATFAGFFR